MPAEYLSLSYDEAVEKHALSELPRPGADEVRVVSQTVLVDGDLCIDEDPGQESLFDGAWVFLDGLTVQGALTNSEFESSAVLFVRGDLRVGQWWLTGMNARITGSLHVDRVLITEHNHGALRVDGEVDAPLVLAMRHMTTFARSTGQTVVLDDPVDAVQYLDPAYTAHGKVDLALVWDAAVKRRPLLATPQATKGEQKPAVDPAWSAARALIEHWRDTGAVVFASSLDLDQFNDELTRVLEMARDCANPASAVGSWLMEHDDVEDILVEDRNLFELASTLSTGE